MSRRKLQWRQRLMQAGQEFETKNHADRAFRDQRLPQGDALVAAVNMLAPEGMKDSSMARVVAQFRRKL